VLLNLIEDVPHRDSRVFAAIRASSDPVALFGAGDMAWYVAAYLRENGIEPVCICDSNPAKHGTLHAGLPVCGYDALKATLAGNGGKYSLVVSVGPQSKDAVFSQLAEVHEQNPIWYVEGYELRGQKTSYQYIREHIAQFEAAYAALGDALSKKVFVNVLNAKLSGDSALYTEILSQAQYFDADVVGLASNEILLDVGAHKGDSIVAFSQNTGQLYEAIIALEPDAANLAILRRTVTSHGIKNVEIHNKGAWNRHAFLHFHDGREGSSRISEDADVRLSAESIEVDAIDNILDGRRVTYVLMDIEGAERNAILGAARTIKEWKPRMAVCVYHRREDMFDILLLLKSFVPEYKFYMRHYTCNQTETVLYAM
jgi:FkbM family methyltransferase